MLALLATLHLQIHLPLENWFLLAIFPHMLYVNFLVGVVLKQGILQLGLG